MTTRTKSSALFLHGFLGQPDDWNQVLQDVAILQGWNVDCFNLWEDLPILKFRSMSEWVDALAASYEASSPIVVCGYSLGARLAMSLACRHPDMVQALVAISGHPGLLSDSERSARIADDQRWGEIFLDEPWPDAIELWNQRGVFNGHEIQPKADSFSPAKLQAALEIFSLGRQPDLRPCLQQLEMPILWIVGENDPKFVKLAEEDWTRTPSITVKRIPDCGHRVLHEKPRELGGCLDAFFANTHQHTY